MMKRSCFVFLAVLPVLLQAQLIHTAHFTEKLEEFGCEFHRAVDIYYHVIPKGKDDFHTYELALVSDNEKTEYRYVFFDDRQFKRTSPPIFVNAKLTSVASNDEDAWIHARTYRPDEAAAYFGADWAFRANFQPKESFSEKARAKMFAIYKEGQGLVLIYAFYDQEEDLPHERANIISFLQGSEGE